MSQSYRYYFQNAKGRCRLNFSSPDITAYSAVLVTACEWDPTIELNPNPHGGLKPQVRWPHGRTMLKAADVYVTNIGTYDHLNGTPGGGVEFYLHVDSKTPIIAQITVTVLGPLNWVADISF